MSLLVRDSLPCDVPAFAAIYAYSVLHGNASFEIDPPSAAELGRRRDALLAAGGRTLLPPLIERCEAAGLRLMVAVIGDSANYAPIRLHERCGFRRAGLLPAIGWNHGRWLDSVLMQQRPLGPRASEPPPPGAEVRPPRPVPR